MSWAKLDDHFPTHPKVARAGGDAGWLYVCALCYCAEHLTNGIIPKSLVGRISDRRAAHKLAERLVEVDLFIDRGHSYEINDYLIYNPSREKVEEERDAAKERRENAGRRGGKRSADVRANDSSPVPVPVPQERETRTTFISDEFEVTPDMRQWADERCPGVDVGISTQVFVNYWKEKRDVGAKAGRKVDWPRTWRTWLLNDYARLPAWVKKQGQVQR